MVICVPPVLAAVGMNAVFDHYLKSLERTERLPPRELALYNQDLLIRLIRHAQQKSPLYQSRLAALFTLEGEVDLTRWNGVPLLTRDDLSRHGQDVRVADLAAEYGEITEIRTSGSTGTPLQVARNGMVLFTTSALFARAGRRFGMDTSRPLARITAFPREQIEPYPEGSIRTGWSYPHPSAPYHKLRVFTPVLQQVE